MLAFGTFAAALASTITLMIVARVIQGIGGAVFPLAFSIIRDEFPRERIAVGIAMISALVGIGGGLGIVLAGPITENLNYHWLFWLPLLAVVPAALVTMFVIPESPIRSPGKIDWPGGVLLAGWLVALLVAVSEGLKLGLDVGCHAGPAGRLRGDRQCLDRGRNTRCRTLGGHDHAARPAGLDD